MRSIPTIYHGAPGTCGANTMRRQTSNWGQRDAGRPRIVGARSVHPRLKSVTKTPDIPVGRGASPETAGREARGANSRMQRGLVAMGTVAVLTVYSAGYEKTRAAAQRFADEDAVRRPPPPPVAGNVVATPAVEGTPESLVETAAQAVIDTALQLADPVPAPRTDPPKAQSAQVASGTAMTQADQAVAAPSPAGSTRVAQATGFDSGSSTPASTPAKQSSSSLRKDSGSVARDSAAVRADSAPAVVVADSTASSDTSTAQATDAAPVQVSPWEDGTYTGWGSSRHGDIQATVTVEAGRITSARISRCLTRYSCSWISALPPQVVERQSPETDYVSGATQSTNAFYYAVVEALSKARR